MDWFLASLGNARGEVSLDGWASPLALVPGVCEAVPFDGSGGDAATMCSSTGKLGDSEDSLLFFGARIPVAEGFHAAARLTVTRVGAAAGWQSGYGLFAIDTLASADGGCRHRNMVGAGRHRGLVTDVCACGLRAVAGHMAPLARDFGQTRRTDASRTLPDLGAAPAIVPGESLLVELSATDRGIRARLTFGGRTGELSLAGGDFLAVQDQTSVYVGVGVAGDLDVEVSDLTVASVPGGLRHTPDDEVQMRVPDYPFVRDLPCMDVPGIVGVSRPGALYAAPNGAPNAPGTKAAPLDLQGAILRARPWNRIVLLDGTYRPAAPIVVPRHRAHMPCSLRAEHVGGAVLDGSSIDGKLPIMVVRGDGWRIRGLVLTGGPSVGLHVCGSHNVVERCETHHNGDTGLLVCAYPGTPRDGWPHDNLVRNCDSHDNRDAAGENADGFGAKLSLGEGNAFVGCIAHHNADDGFDLYGKSILGPTGAVALRGCVAYANGMPDGEEAPSAPVRGTGFKLGGENQPVPHQMRDCLAYGNCRSGVSSNSNPSVRLRDVVAWDNGPLPAKNNIRLVTGRNDTVPSWEAVGCVSGYEGILPEEVLSRAFRSTDVSVPPARRPDGSIDLHGLFELAGECPDKLRYRKGRGPSGQAPAKDGDQRLRLMFVVPRTSGGGAERVITTLASSMAKRHDVSLVTTVREDGRPGYELSRDVTYVNLYDWQARLASTSGTTEGLRLPGRLGRAADGVRRGIAAVARRVPAASEPLGAGAALPLVSVEEAKLLVQAEYLRQLKREMGVDCSISFLNSANYLNALSHGDERCIVSIRSHIDGPFAPRECRTEEGRRRIEAACKGADAVVAVSEELAQTLRDELGVSPERLRVIHNGVDIDAVRTRAGRGISDEALRQAIDASPFTFVSNGRLTTKKGHWHIVRAFSRVVERHPDALLVLLGREGRGDEDTSGLVKDAIRALGLERNVIMPGFQDNPFGVVARCDALVMASFNEGFPNALIEAMALGVPVISTDCSSGPREILAPETDYLCKATSMSREPYGILVPECSGSRLAGEPLEPAEEELASAMLALVEDEPLRAGLAERGLERARELSRGRFLSRWREVIEHG